LWEHAGAQRNKSLANANVAALKEQLTRGLPSSFGAGGGPTAGCIHRCKQSNAHPYHGRFLPVLIRNLAIPDARTIRNSTMAMSKLNRS
jgi:hypothetical protein